MCSSPAPPGLFYFDASYRPVPLEMQFVGVSEKNYLARQNVMNEVCYNKVRASARVHNLICAYNILRK